MLSKKKLFENKEQISSCRDKIIKNTNLKINELFHDGDALEFLKKIKFEQCGYDPLFEESINIIEQINQTFTYLVCLKAAEILLSKYPLKRFYINFGTQAGYDVISEDERIICECFAVTSPDSNSKLEMDTKKVSLDTISENKYVIYYSKNQKPIHVANIKQKYPNVQILELDDL
ncbi:hypothetical protein [Aminipila sp.]|uniref:hypothetical protein n=1 Tax=Aminipila sp. TaxID=2060095 RepID=UPI002896C098|nr:hypothetical protein [Aminipila sp.]